MPDADARKNTEIIPKAKSEKGPAKVIPNHLQKLEPTKKPQIPLTKVSTETVRLFFMNCWV